METDIVSPTQVEYITTFAIYHSKRTKRKKLLCRRSPHNVKKLPNQKKSFRFYTDSFRFYTDSVRFYTNSFRFYTDCLTLNKYNTELIFDIYNQLHCVQYNVTAKVLTATDYIPFKTKGYCMYCIVFFNSTFT